MESFIVLIIAAIVITVIILISVFSKKAIVKRKLRKTPSKKIQDFKNDDIAKLTGSVECINKPLIAPLSGRECTYYYVKVEKRVSTGKSSHWKKIIEEEIANDFIIRDDTGTAIINTNNVKSYLVVDAKYRSGFWEDATNNLEAYLNKHGRQSVGFMGMNNTIRYREAVLEIGEQIAVVGKAQWNEMEGDKVVEIVAFGEEPVYLSDDPDTLEFVEEKTADNDIRPRFKKIKKLEKRSNKKRESRYKKEY